MIALHDFARLVRCRSRPASRCQRGQQPVIFLALLLFSLLVRAQTFGNPVLGFDEQFYLLVGDRMLHGLVPFIDIFDRKPIGLFLIYAGIRSLGGDGFVQYQIVATGFVAATAFVIYRTARQLGDEFSAGTAACLYILWLCFTDCQGGQAPVFYNLPVSITAYLTLRAVITQRKLVALGCAAMLLAGIAVQIKYTAIFDSFFFGLALLWTRYRADGRLLPMVPVAMLWTGCVLLPTALAALIYWKMGALGAFLFANFLSGFGRVPDSLQARLAGLIVITSILAPLVFFMALGPRPQERRALFIWLWLAACVFGVLAIGSFLGRHYAAPILLPLTIATVPYFTSTARRQLTGLALVAFAVPVAQLAIYVTVFQEGGRSQALAVAEAARPRHGCIYVYNGYPALYLLTKSCLPTRWVFPGHLNTRAEASIKAIGVDPMSEEHRILDNRPDVIIDASPVYALGNTATHALVEAALEHNYRLAAKIRTGAERYQLVYVLNQSYAEPGHGFSRQRDSAGMIHHGG